MITYSAYDIIKKATQLSDLENSDFISWNENMTLLNDAYIKVYGDMINQNDLYWLKTLYLTPDYSASEDALVYTLPYDFYQLQSLTVYPNMQPILRRAKNETVKAQRYEIINNKLYVYGVGVTTKFCMKYYPVPMTLTYPAKDTEIALSSDSWLDCCNNKYVSVSGTSVTLYDFSLSTSTTFTLPASVTNAKAILAKKNILIWSGSSTYSSATFYDIDIYSGNIDTLSLTNSIPLKKDGNVYIMTSVAGTNNKFTHTINSYIYANSSWNTIAEQTFDTTDNPFSSADMNTNGAWSSGIIYFCSNKVLYKYTSSSSSVCNYIKEMPIETINGAIYYNDEYNNIYSGDVKIIDGDKVANIIGINKVDNETGYGITVVPSDDNSIYVIKSTAIDTVLSYPVNVLYTILSFYLAIAYKIKQNADATLLSQQLSSAELEYSNSLNNDVNTYVRISNSYATNGVFGL